jgi:parallel beta-helix repeat protein
MIVLILVMLPSSGERPAPLPISSGSLGPVGPVARPCEGIVIAVADDVQAVIDSHPPGTTFCLSAGIHRLDTPLVPRHGDAIVGERGAVLNGSKVLTDWHSDGRLWWTNGFLPPAPATNGECVESVTTCTYAEDVFLDKKRLERVTSLGAVTAGTVHADYETNTITIGDDPRSHLVEQAVAPSLIQSTADDVTVANLVVEQAANDAQVGAIENRQVTPHAAGSGWRIFDNEVRLNHGVGIGFGYASTVSRNFVHHQGQLGMGVWGIGSLISDNEISFNGTAGYSAEWEAGGAKLWKTERTTLVRNYVHENMGPGLWADGGNIDTVYDGNRIANNWNAGIQHEISYDAVITHNEVSGNGRMHKGWAWDAGIQIQSSGGNALIEVAYNLVSDNANGIALIESGDRAWEDPAPHGPHTVRNVWVHDNIVWMQEGETTGVVDDLDDPSVYADNNNRFDNNTYYLGSLTDTHFAWGGVDMDWSGWHGSMAGQDPNGWADVVSR